MNLNDQIKYLVEFATPERIATFKKIIENRTRYITVVLEDIYQSHNASAVVRSCDCFGVQDLHIIENRNKYEVNPDVALGAYKWLNMIKHNENENNTLDCIRKLKKQNYRIVATTPHTNDRMLPDFDPTIGKFALFFGTEMRGLTDTVLENADEYIRIPMYGFTESFNISVSVAICLYDLTERLRKSDINYLLSNTEKQEIMLNWLKQSIKNSKDILEKNKK
jgi:tRNA (guanosine-2'-O-)-methyltransferase